MHRTKKGNQLHFGMKLHVDTDPRDLVHHPEGTAANVAVHCHEPGQAPNAGALEQTAKARVRARVEHPFRIVKRVFGYDRVRYRGLERTCSGLRCFRTSRT